MFSVLQNRNYGFEFFSDEGDLEVIRNPEWIRARIVEREQNAYGYWLPPIIIDEQE